MEQRVHIHTTYYIISWHIQSANLWQICQEYTMRKGDSNKWCQENWIFTCKIIKVNPTAYWKAQTSLCQQRWYSQSNDFSTCVDVRLGPYEKAEHWRIDAFKLWCWRRLLRVTGTARRSNQSILKEISPEYSSEELMLKLKPQYFGHLMQRAGSLEKTLMLEKMEGRRRWGQQRLDGILDSMDVSLSKLQG